MMTLRTTGCIWLCLIAGGAALAAHAETPYAYGPSSPAFAPSDLDKVKAPGAKPVKAQAVHESAAPLKAAKSEDISAGLPAGPQAYAPAAQPVAAVPAAEPAPVKAVAAKPVIKAEARVAPVKASAQTLMPLPVATAATPLPSCNYNQIRKTGFDAYVGHMWAARTPEAQKALIGCIDATWTYHLSAANTEPNTHFEEMASPAMLAAMQYDIDGFVKEMDGHQKLRIMWLATLGSDSFSMNSGAPCQHDDQRRALQVLLDDRKAALQSLVAYRDIQDAFSSIQCRTSAAN
jgi:hypothetical protein